MRNALVLLLLASFFTMVSSTAAHADGGMRNGLPPTSMDSFVHEAGAAAEIIYGDEGQYDIPPVFHFAPENRINAGIYGRRDQGLTTGHGYYMPSAWGADEILDPPGEFSRSGANGGNMAYNGVGAPGVNLMPLQSQMNSAQNMINQAVNVEQQMQNAIGNAQNVMNTVGLGSEYYQAQSILSQSQQALRSAQYAEAQGQQMLQSGQQAFYDAAQIAESGF